MTPTPTGNVAGQPVALITGGASGIGFETARRLAEDGYRVALLDRDEVSVSAAATALGSPHLGIQADVTQLDSLTRAVALITSEFGGIDVVVANAGIGSASTVRASGADRLTGIIDINLSGQINTVKAALESVIERRGYIVFTCSASVLKNTPKSSAYAAAKAGVEAFAGSLRLEVAHLGVNVGVFYPGWTRTPLIQGSSSRSADSQGLPWPLSITSEVNEVADAYRTQILRRARTAYFPRVLRIVHWLRPGYTGAAWDRRLRASTARDVPRWEAAYQSTQQPNNPSPDGGDVSVQ